MNYGRRKKNKEIKFHFFFHVTSLLHHFFLLCTILDFKSGQLHFYVCTYTSAGQKHTLHTILSKTKVVR